MCILKWATECIARPLASLWEQIAPQLANLFLFHYEYSYMKGLMRDNLCIAKRFSDTVRYIDDLLTLNNNSFEEEIINIYHPELTLKKTTESNSRISYLDISISICMQQ